MKYTIRNIFDKLLLSQMELLQFQIEISLSLFQFFHPTHSFIADDSHCTNDTMYIYIFIILKGLIHWNTPARQINDYRKEHWAICLTDRFLEEQKGVVSGCRRLDSFRSTISVRLCKDIERVASPESRSSKYSRGSGRISRGTIEINFHIWPRFLTSLVSLRA